MAQRLASSLAAAACLGWLTLGAAAGAGAGADERVIRLGVPPWQGAQVKTAVVTELLERLGWRVEWTEAAAPLIFQELAQGRLDANLSAWVPGQDDAFRPLVDEGRIRILGENLAGARTGLAVPVATAPAGLESLADLARAGAAFDRRIHCIEPGSGANTVTEAAIEQDLYGLGEWSIVPSSTEAMLTQVGRTLRREEPIVFCAWSPHWMNIAYELRYLDDPEDHWGGKPGSTKVLTLARADLEADHPSVARLLARFRVDASVQSRWIHEYARLDRERAEVAREWVANHRDLVASWLEGLDAAHGTPAAERFAASFERPVRTD